MAERLETDLSRRLQAGQEAVELLDQSGFVIEDYQIDGEPQDATFDLSLTLGVGELTRPLEVLEDDDTITVDFGLGRGFSIGLAAGVTAASCGCSRDEAPR